MVTVNGLSIYLINKIDDYLTRFGDENINRYMGFYDGITFPNLKTFFSLFHYEFNYLFSNLNSRLNSGHYTANESRDLIYLHDELKTLQSNLKDTDYDFDVNPYYKSILNKCDKFLQSSGGSPIPNDFEKINIIEVAPVFILKSHVKVKRVNKEVSIPIKPIGRGSYATVYRYKDDFYNRFFVLKKANKNLNETEYNRFKIEFNQMKELNSPYVIEVFNFDEEKHQYIMEYADETLDSYISKNNTKLEVRNRVSLIKQIFQAFIYINGKGVLHRDISTTNVLLKKYEGLMIIKISDFGLVKLKNSQLTRKSTEIKGFLNDPKLEIIGFGNYEIRHETYAITRLVYFVMTGKLRIDTYKSTEFKAFIEKGISDNINERYNSVKELQDAFYKIIHTLFEKEAMS